MVKRAKADILGCQVDLVTAQESVAIIKELIGRRLPAHVITLNAEIVCQAQNNRELLNIINQADLVTPDGIGIVWGGRQLGYAIPERVTGIDLLQRLCQVAPAEDWGIYLLGSAPGVADQAARRLAATYPGLRICGTQHGYFRGWTTGRGCRRDQCMRTTDIVRRDGSPQTGIVDKPKPTGVGGGWFASA